MAGTSVSGSGSCRQAARPGCSNGKGVLQTSTSSRPGGSELSSQCCKQRTARNRHAPKATHRRRRHLLACLIGSSASRFMALAPTALPRKSSNASPAPHLHPPLAPLCPTRAVSIPIGASLPSTTVAQPLPFAPPRSVSQRHGARTEAATAAGHSRHHLPQRRLCTVPRCLRRLPRAERGPRPVQPGHRREHRQGGAARCLPKQPELLRPARRAHKGLQRRAHVPDIAFAVHGLADAAALRLHSPLRLAQGASPTPPAARIADVCRSSSRATSTTTSSSPAVSTGDGPPPLCPRPPSSSHPRVTWCRSRTTTLAPTSRRR